MSITLYREEDTKEDIRTIFHVWEPMFALSVN